MNTGPSVETQLFKRHFKENAAMSQVFLLRSVERPFGEAINILTK